MEAPFEAFLADLYLAGRLSGDPAELVERLNTGAPLGLTELSVLGLDAPATSQPRHVASASIAPDDLFVVVLPADPRSGVVHAAHHPIELTLGPYRVAGEIATLPGYDPGRALARPSGQFLTLTNARVEARVADGTFVQTYGAVLVNRYAVERVAAAIDLNFFFPGAEFEQAPEA